MTADTIETRVAREVQEAADSAHHASVAIADLRMQTALVLLDDAIARLTNAKDRLRDEPGDAVHKLIGRKP